MAFDGHGKAKWQLMCMNGPRSENITSLLGNRNTFSCPWCQSSFFFASEHLIDLPSTCGLYIGGSIGDMEKYPKVYALCRRPRPLLIALGLQILGIGARGSWHFWYANLSFGMLGGFTLASWGTLGRSKNTGEHSAGHFGVQAKTFTDFRWI